MLFLGIIHDHHHLPITLSRRSMLYDFLVENTKHKKKCGYSTSHVKSCTEMGDKKCRTKPIVNREKKSRVGEFRVKPVLWLHNQIHHFQKCSLSLSSCLLVWLWLRPCCCYFSDYYCHCDLRPSLSSLVSPFI